MFLTTSFELYFSILASAKGFAGSVLTSCLRGIHNAWHFYYALILVIKVVYGGIGIALFTP
ncbi:hypothetical protein BJL76_22880 [Vibrio parahaemolyticus]|nr:hypothetical protein BBM20_01410 [Vibrio parahaemolyticus]OOX37833.1 hypothetical protein BJL76_23335 [Vibrio parahaemolyticus]OOX38697.1 hypothetical protein BJL76_22880 [Vibrio parahaemolyticus]OOX49614.1 hypothetical protein BJL79_23755 [Vibrio parahaemolyticus]OOX49640.1 hypothetical protein BJL79_23595 [Vibrio parahaemolyticus]